MKKVLRDFALIFYDDLSFRALSMVRITFFNLFLLFSAACLLDFFGRDIKCFTPLVTVIGIVAGMYVGKRFTWKQQQEQDKAKNGHGEG